MKILYKMYDSVLKILKRPSFILFFNPVRNLLFINFTYENKEKTGKGSLDVSNIYTSIIKLVFAKLYICVYIHTYIQIRAGFLPHLLRATLSVFKFF